MIELTGTKQRKGEPIIDCINRWRALSIDCKDILVLKIKKEKKEEKSTEKVSKGATKEAMVVSTTPLKLVSKENKVKELQDKGKKRRLTLIERQEKVYPFPDSNLPDMLEQLLEKQLIQLPEYKRPVGMKRENDSNDCKYHRVVNHSVEKYFVLKELILKLAIDKKIKLDLDDVALTNHAAVIIHPDSRLPAIGSLIQFGSLEHVVIYFSPEALQNNDFHTICSKKEEKRRGKSQRRKTRKNARKLLPIVEESEELLRPQKPITLKDFSPENFPMEVVLCHTISTTKDYASPSNLMEIAPKP
ncbi:ty3-gypsy retrotransposon protein [Cucumis melo var. makuwa]|uniref:Ty3-gypsy retrotransposon protein n=1 Tax=Cucumis melo var. makuwa TaxID=1194695 RepID=A0A5D3BXR1_CUCMM|nr:ty3-gypsy retrotransposon protein [Cucumis melo var. makuwa]TYK03778.1 ty3-gypsy retrotransposon protein [Cucumis melo var. makuwa]